ncbi:MAG: TolC family protein [Spirochaetales bacterium]
MKIHPLTSSLPFVLTLIVLATSTSSSLPFSEENKLLLDLPLAIQLAKAQSLEFAYANYQQLWQQERYRLSLRQLFPHINLGYTQMDTVVYYAPDSHLHRISMGIEYELYDRGKKIQDRELQYATLQLNKRQLDLQEDSLALNTLLHYLSLLGRKKQEEILFRLTEKTRQQANIAKKEFQLGERTELEYLSILLKEKDLQIEQMQLEREIERLQFELRKALHIPEEKQISLKGRIDATYAGFFALDHAREYLPKAIKSSLELEQKRIEVLSASYDLKRVEQAFFPRIGVMCNFFVEGPNFPLTQWGFSIGLRLSWDTPPVSLGMQLSRRGTQERSRSFDGQTSVWDNLEEYLSPALARLQLSRSETGFQATLRELEFSFKESLQNLQEKQTLLQLLKEKEQLLQRKLSIEKVKLRIGEGTRLQYLESEIDLARLQMSILETLLDLYSLETNLLKIVGLSQYGTYPVPIIKDPEEAAEDASQKEALP